MEEDPDNSMIIRNQKKKSSVKSDSQTLQKISNVR